MNTDATTIEMTDEEEAAFNAAVADPATIASETQAQEIIECLDDDIEQIRAQLNAAKIEAETCGGLSEGRQDWVRRASNALVWKLKSRASVGRRLDELRPKKVVVAQVYDKTIAQITAKVANRVAVAKLKLEEQVLIRERQAQHQAAKERNIAATSLREASQSRLFVMACKDQLPQEYVKIWSRAREMFPDHPSWADAP